MSQAEKMPLAASSPGAGAYKSVEERSRDREIVDRIRSGEPRCFEMFVYLYERPLFNFILGHRLDQDAAADLTQESFLKAYRGLGSFDPERSGFKTWLYTIAFNLIRDRARRAQTRAREIERFAYTPPAPDAVERCEARQLVDRLLDLLDSDARQLVAMKFLQDLPYESISEITGSPQSTVRSKIHRALKKIRKARSGEDGREDHC